jgi:membrane-associated phospholipid phosphatase
MTRLVVKPTAFDKALANTIERRVPARLERYAGTLTLLADERLLLAATFSAWGLSRLSSSDAVRRGTSHIALSVAAAAIIPHVMKGCVSQTRPDRHVHGPRHGIPKSGYPSDAFPSGHAMHMGAIASAFSWMSPNRAWLAWTVAGAISATRVVLLAHWASDVLVGLGLGALVERLLRPSRRG